MPLSELTVAECVEVYCTDAGGVRDGRAMIRAPGGNWIIDSLAAYFGAG
jgi:hypothetical protein